MASVFYDANLESFLLEQGDRLFDPDYIQAAPNSPLRHLEPNDHSVRSHDVYLQSLWTMNDVNQNMSTTSASNDADFMGSDTANILAKVETARDHLWTDLGGSNPNGYIQASQSPTRASSAKESPREVISSVHAPRSRHPKPSISTGPFKCDWKGCTNSRVYTRDASLWRHIKDKHVYPDAFKCHFPRCESSYGRMDKLQEHLRTTHANFGDLKSEHRCSCHA